MAQENNEEKEVKMTEKKKSPVFLILGIVLVLLVIGGAGAGYFLFISPKAESPAAATQPAAAPAVPQDQNFSAGAGMSGPMKSLDSFIVNLTDAQGTRYLKVVMQLEMSNELLGPEIDRKAPQIRDEVIMLLSSKSFDDVSTIAGKRALKRSILNSVNKYLASGRVLRVYFSDFVVQ